jgi:hypothetical protein
VLGQDAWVFSLHLQAISNKHLSLGAMFCSTPSSISLDSNLLGLRSLCWWVKMFPSRWSVTTCRFLGFLSSTLYGISCAARLWVSHRIPRTFYPKSCRAYFGFWAPFLL